MAGSSFFALFDDIATLLDDVSLMTKVATRKTAGVLGDDLALNAQQVSGVPVNRELPVVWAVAKGSLLNKAILVPLALIVSAFLPAAVTWLLMMGGAYLCFEGFEKVLHSLTQDKQEREVKREARRQALQDTEVDMVAFEKDKIKGAIRTDFILSAEIIVISLGTMGQASLPMQLVVLVAISLLITVGVYGVVAGLIKIDDLGLHMSNQQSSLARSIGESLLVFAPYLMKTLSIVGTAAMFTVGGSILAHGIHTLQAGIDSLAPADGAASFLVPVVLQAAVGVIAGGIVAGMVELAKKLFLRKNSRTQH